MDFYKIQEIPSKKGTTDIIADFKVCPSKDLMVQGKSFRAIWDEEKGLWSTDEYDVARLVDEDLRQYYESKREYLAGNVNVRYMSNYSSKMWVEFKNYVQRVADNSHPLDNKIVFSNTPVDKKDYCSKKLSYPLEDIPCPSWEEIISTLYSPEERAKIEWAIGSIIAGDSKSIQKFLVFYGDPGTGKSTILEIIQKLFDGYYIVFEAKTITSNNNQFATEAFRSNPLLAIQHDGDLSRIEDNSKLNSIVSHEEIIINEKYKASYPMRVNCMLMMATNKPVKITDGKAGLIRRLIDIRPSGNKLTLTRYNELMNQIDFELPGIAWHCLKTYQSMGKGYYNTYRPVDMMYKTDPFFNFVEDSYEVFESQDGISLKQAYAMYKEYCDESNADYKLQMYKFREELKNYFKKFEDTVYVDGHQVRSYYSGFLSKKFKRQIEPEKKEVVKIESWIDFKEQPSLMDILLKDCPAQYASEAETPSYKWANVKTKLNDIQTDKLHYLKVPENLIVIDFDIKDETGKKSYEKNLEAASKWPKTYAETSKSKAGIHLHYFYNGDVSKLSRVYDDNIEVKVFSGNSSLRRMLTLCNDIDIATISSGLPLKEESKMINFDSVKNEKAIRTLIKKNLNKEIHPATKPSMDFIKTILDQAYDNGVRYDISDLRPAIMAFAAQSTNQSDYCLKLLPLIKFKSDDPSESISNSVSEDDIVFYDIEVFPNLLLICWKKIGEGHKIHDMFNPTPQEMESFLKMKLVGFNCRRYDNHICYAKYMGYNNEQLFDLSQRIINKSENAMFGEAYNISFTDIYDFASAGNKKSLKKLEIEMGIHHQELGLPWDKPVDEKDWPRVAKYCHYDVEATEASWHYLRSDWLARKILADIAEMSVNDTTNSLTTKIIFGSNRKPQGEFNYRDLSQPVKEMDEETYQFLKEVCPEMMATTHGTEKSLLPYFPGYVFRYGKSYYKDFETGEGGFVYAQPGIWYNVALLDIASMHPHSTIAECLFGVRYTKAFRDIVEGRVSIKHEAWIELDNILGGKLKPYVELVTSGVYTSKDLANALKTAINSVYGLTDAGFSNPFRDPRNIDNIVAKRGALFMINLKEEVEKRGYSVAHIKTDSIKIPNATPDIVKFVMDYGKRYGYSFEHEATYEKMCLVNDAVYIAKYANAEVNGKHAGEWTATGTQFQIPYVFKTLFSHEPITFSDMCETKSVTSALYLDMNENLGDEHNYQFIGKVSSFCPIKPGCGGGLLLREKTGGGYASATGAKDFRWLESETVMLQHKEEDIDRTYYNRLVDGAIEAISKYGDFEQFAS